MDNEIGCVCNESESSASECEEDDKIFETNEMNNKNGCKREMVNNNKVNPVLEYIEPLSKDITAIQRYSNPEKVDAILGPMLDVKFNVKGNPLFVNSKVLSKISPYWKRCFEHCKDYNNNSYKEFDIDDFEYDSVLHLIQVAYTNDPTIGVQPEKKSDTWDRIILADKYQLRGFGTSGSKGLLNDLNIENSAELYFGFSWRLPSLKSKIESYTIDNFQKIIKTDAYINILKNHDKYPKFLDLYGEILPALLLKQ